MKKLINNTAKLFIICLFFMGTQANAQDDEADILFPVTQDPGAPAPINDYLPLLLLGGIALGFVYYRKRQTV